MSLVMQVSVNGDEIASLYAQRQEKLEDMPDGIGTYMVAVTYDRTTTHLVLRHRRDDGVWVLLQRTMELYLSGQLDEP